MADKVPFLESIGGASIIGGASSLLSSALNSIVDSININKQIKAQAAENQKTREYNLGLAKLQNQWNIDQWNRENEYNSPENQMQLLAAAGLNPDLMYGRGTSGMTAATSPAMTSGAPAIAQDMSAIGRPRNLFGALGTSVNEMLNRRFMEKQIELLDSQKEKNLSDAGLSDSKKEGQDLTNQNILAMDSAKIQSLLSSAGLSNQQIIESQKRIDEINASIDKMYEEILTIQQARSFASENQTMNWLRFNMEKEMHDLRKSLGWQEYSQAKRMFEVSIQLMQHSRDLENFRAKMQKVLYHDYLAGPEHFQTQWYGVQSIDWKIGRFKQDRVQNDINSWTNSLNNAAGAASSAVSAFRSLRTNPQKLGETIYNYGPKGVSKTEKTYHYGY